MNAIKGFEITVQDLQGKVKISQNKSKDDLISVLKTLNNSSSDQEKAIPNSLKIFRIKGIENNDKVFKEVIKSYDIGYFGTF